MDELVDRRCLLLQKSSLEHWEFAFSGGVGRMGRCHRMIRRQPLPSRVNISDGTRRPKRHTAALRFLIPRSSCSVLRGHG